MHMKTIHMCRSETVHTVQVCKHWLHHYIAMLRAVKFFGRKETLLSTAL
jgi:hypothetical protein